MPPMSEANKSEDKTPPSHVKSLLELNVYTVRPTTIAHVRKRACTITSASYCET